MTGDIALILAVDGLATGAIYVLVGLGLVLIFSTTRVIFVPFGDIVAFSALTLSSLQLGRVPGTIQLVVVLALTACAVDAVHHWRRGQPRRIVYGLIGYGLLPIIPALIALAAAGTTLPAWAQILLALALVTPIGPLIDRIALRPIADASVLLLLIVSVALHYGLAGMGLTFFGAEGFRTQPLTTAMFEFAGMPVSGQTVLMIAAAVVFSLMLYLFFEYTLPGKALRATAVNRVGARLVGIRTALAGGLSFFLAAFIGTLSGILIGPITTIYYDTGFLIGLKGFVGAILGGMASYPLAVVGSLALGLLEAYASFWSSAFKETIVFLVIIPPLIWLSLRSRHVEEEEEE
jgi:branched-subunit amino acid ABC-type transport system permease component